MQRATLLALLLCGAAACRTTSEDTPDAPVGAAGKTPTAPAPTGSDAPVTAPAATGAPGATAAPGTGSTAAPTPPSPEASACLAALKPAITQTSFTVCLGALIRLKTVNPPGDEGLAARFYADVFTASGIPAQVFEVPNRDELNLAVSKRVNVLASLAPPNAPADLPSVILLNHLDTVDVHPDQWTLAAPFFGGIAGGYLIGRGALDMKDLGILQMLAMLQLKGTPLAKAVHFLGVADEEVAESGTLGALAEIRAGGLLPGLANARVVLNEGGFGLQDAIGDGSQLHVIATEERGGAWIRLRAPSAAQLAAAAGLLNVLPDRGTALGDRRANLRRKLEGWGCDLVSFATPNASYNVVPSVVTMTLSCKNRPSADDWAWIFDYDPEFALAERLLGLADDGRYATWKVEDEGSLLRVTLTGTTTAHSSTSAQPSALDVAVWGLRRLQALGTAKNRQRPPFMAYQLTPATKLFLSAVGRNHRFGGAILPHPDDLGGWIEALPPRLEQRFLRAIGGKAGIEKALRTSCTWTALTVGAGAADAVFDCRLVNLRPLTANGPTHYAEFTGQLERLFAANGLRGVSLATEVGWNFTASPADGPDFRAIKEVLEKAWPGSEATAFMNPGGTDSSYFRDPSSVPTTALKPVAAYGLTPAMVTPDVLRTFHGSDERFPVDQAARAVDAYRSIVAALARAP